MNWVSIETTALDVARSVTGLAVNSLCQSTLLIVAGFIFAWLLRRRGSAVQSAIYRTTLIAVLMCPFATWILSRVGMSGWSIEMPVAWQLAAQPELPNGKVSPEQDAATGDHDSSSLAAPPNAVGVPAPVDMASDTARAARLLDGSGSNGNSRRNSGDAARVITPATESASETIGDARAVGIRRFGWIAMGACVVWFVVATALLTRLSLAWRQLAVTRRRALPADDETVRMSREVAALFGVRPPDVRLSPFLPSPCLAGLRRPVVLLPDAEFQLSLHDILIHELAHLARHDCQWNLARRLATSLFFFQPLLWRLSRQMETSAEEVCDDCVVSLGANRREYAHRLVDMAELSTASLAAAGVGIVSFRSMLGRRVARIMDSSRSLSTRVGYFLLLVVLAGGLVATVLAGLVGLGPRVSAAGTDAASVKQEDVTPESSVKHDLAKAADNDVVIVHGSVIDPEGAPVAAADVYVLRWYWDFGDKKPLAETKTGKDGKFEISYRKSQFMENAGRPDQWREAAIAAFAKGFGPGWTTYEQIPLGSEATIRLVVDDLPIEGRLIDLEGKPVAGARVNVSTLAMAKDEDLTAWLDAVRAGQSTASASNALINLLPVFSSGVWPSISTDVDGRFRLEGIGRERLVTLDVSGATIVTTDLSVATRIMQPITHAAYDFPGAPNRTNYGARFESTLAPSRPIEGTVLDATTRQPIAGVEIWSTQFAGEKISGIHSIKVKSDDNGHYRLDGMPKGAGNRIVVVPIDQPYFTANLDVPDPPGIDPVPLEIELHRGIWVSGHVTDKVSGRGVASRIYYMPFPDNPHAHETPEFVNQSYIMSVQDRFRTDVNGRYRVVALPGHGIIAAGSVLDPYPGGQGYDEIKGLDDRLGFEKFGSALTPTKKYPTAVKEVQITDDAQHVDCDFALEPGQRATLRVVDSAGKPLDALTVEGISGSNNDHSQLVSTPEFEIVALRNDETRTVLLHDKRHNLGKTLRVTPADRQAGPITVRLEPCAKVVGHLVDGNGDPVRGSLLRIEIANEGDYGKGLEPTATDGDGRFSHDGLLPGLPYSIIAEGAKVEFADVAKELAVHPGETIDLGTIDISSKERPEPMRMKSANESGERSLAATSASAEIAGGSPGGHDLIKVDGHVVDPDGKPVAGAVVRLAGDDTAEALATTTNVDGRFEIQFDKTKFTKPEWHEQPWRLAKLYAVANGFAPAWVGGNELEVDPNPTLRLKRDDSSIRGQIVTLEGQPVPNARLVVWGIHDPHDGTLDQLFEALRKSPTSRQVQTYLSKTSYLSAQLLDLHVKQGRLSRTKDGHVIVIADIDGRFEFSGIGSERLLRGQFEGTNIQSKEVDIVTRPKIDDWWKHETLNAEARMRLEQGESLSPIYAATFQHFAAPSVPIAGVVRDHATGEVIEGISVTGDVRGAGDHAGTVTDKDGRFELTGLALDGTLQLYVGPADSTRPLYVGIERTIELAGGAASKPTNTEIDLTRGILVRGKVTDADSEKPVKARIEYLGYDANPHLRDLTDTLWPYSEENTDGKGEFAIIVPPGPGALAVWTPHGVPDQYHSANADDFGTPISEDGWINTANRGLISPTQYKAAKFIDLKTGEKPAALALTVKPYTDIARVRCVDERGQVTNGVTVAGYQPWSGNFPDLPHGGLELGSGVNSYLEIAELSAKSRKPVIFRHQEKHVAAILYPSGSSRRPRLADLKQAPDGVSMIPLTPAGSITGQLVDAEGRPVRNAVIWLKLVADSDASVADLELVHLPVRENGHFEVRELPAGGPYRLTASDGSLPGRIIKQEFELSAGETIDLGTSDITGDRPMPMRMMPAANEGSESRGGDAHEVSAPAESTAPAKTSDEKTTGAATAADKSTPQITGHVLGPDGKPVAGASVALVARERANTTGGDFSAERQHILADAVSAEDGSFRLTYQATSSSTHLWLKLLAKAPGSAVAWANVNPDEKEPSVTVTLPAARPVQGRLVTLEGQPAGGVTLRVTQLGRFANGQLDGVQLDKDGPRPAPWPTPAISDEAGYYTVTDVPEGADMSLEVDQEPYAKEWLVWRTSEDKSGAAKVFALPPARVIEGQVVAADTGQPLAHSQLTLFTDGRSGGGMTGIDGQTDANGHFRLNPFHASGYILTAFAARAPYLNVQQHIDWHPDDKGINAARIELPRRSLGAGHDCGRRRRWADRRSKRSIHAARRQSGKARGYRHRLERHRNFRSGGRVCDCGFARRRAPAGPRPQS